MLQGTRLESIVALFVILALGLDSTEGAALDQNLALSQTRRGSGGFLAATGSFTLGGYVFKEKRSLGEDNVAELDSADDLLDDEDDADADALSSTVFVASTSSVAKNAAECAPEGAIDCAGLAPFEGPKQGGNANKYESCPDSLIKGQYFITKEGTKKGRCLKFDDKAVITRTAFSNEAWISGKTVITKAGIWKVNKAHKAVGAIAMKRLTCAKETPAGAGSPTLSSCEMFVASQCFRCPNFQFGSTKGGQATETEINAFYRTCVKVAFDSKRLKADFECNAADMVHMSAAMAAF